MTTTLPRSITVKGNSGANYKLFITRNGKFMMNKPVFKDGEVVVNKSILKPITRERYQKAYEYTQNIAN